MIDESVYIAQGAIVAGNVVIGENSSIWYNTVVRAELAKVSIGAHTNIQDLSMVHVDTDAPCIIGSRVSVGHRAILHGCVIEDDCLIGMGAILLNHVHIGAGSVIGAGAVLTEGSVIPAGSVVIGIPGRVVKPVDEVLQDRIANTWNHYQKEAVKHRTGVIKIHPVSDISSS